MDKQKAIAELGGSITEAAKRLGMTYQGVRKWPETLPPKVAGRVVAYLMATGAKREKIDALLSSSSEA